MSDQPETIAAIVRELREDAQHVEAEIHDDDFWSNYEAAEELWMNYFADDQNREFCDWLWKWEETK